MQLLFNTTGAINGYDQYGHFLRAWLLPNSSCTALFVVADREDCLAHFNEPAPTASLSPSKAQLEAARELRRLAKSDPAAYRQALSELQAGPSAGVPFDALGDPLGGDGGSGPNGSAERSARLPSMADARALLDTVIGRQRPGTGGSQ
jgi:hypothetical protein